MNCNEECPWQQDASPFMNAISTGTWQPIMNLSGRSDLHLRESRSVLSLEWGSMAGAMDWQQKSHRWVAFLITFEVLTPQSL